MKVEVEPASVGEEISGAVGGAGLGNADAGGVVVGSFEGGGVCFSAGVAAACVGSGGGERGGDVAIARLSSTPVTVTV